MTATQVSDFFPTDGPSLRLRQLIMGIDESVNAECRVWVCDRCGSVVFNTYQHARWHAGDPDAHRPGR